MCLIIMSLSNHSLPICSDYPLKVLFSTLASINADCGEKLIVIKEIIILVTKLGHALEV